ncbi:substrate-binding periplasmic protein [Pseudoalteromonas denitrificans]|uniref:substrate-binding periplasmic protein n=1 Tax=Pseudoalteromonas denitrificans TaxID=43656 RepID=UPI001FE908C0|nr:transporter substrate-binding domain-containing protein [Pseudoalteromonas denitrificans]
MLILLITLSFSGKICAFENRPIKISHAYFEPYIWSDNGISKGIYVDILKEVFEKRMGMTIEFESFPWLRAQRRVESGKSDGMITLYTPERAEYTSTGKVPIFIETMGLFTYINHPRLEQMKNIQSIDGIKDFQILTYLGDGVSIEKFPGFDVDYGAVDLKSALKKLNLKRGDVLIQSKAVTLYNIKKLRLDNSIIQVPRVDFGVLEFKLCISKQSPFIDIIPVFDKVLSELIQDGTIQKIFKKYGL